MSKSLSILVYLKRQKKDAQGKIPLYVRVTIDGAYDEFSAETRSNPPSPQNLLSCRKIIKPTSPKV
jgi:hypothetical protein